MNEIINLLEIIAIGTSITGIYCAGRIIRYLFSPINKDKNNQDK